MNFWNIDPRKLIIGGLIIALPLISLNLQRKPGEAAWHTKPFYFIGGLLQRGISEFSQDVQQTTSQYLNLIDIKTNNRRLHRQLAELKARQIDYNELEIENHRLRQLLDFKQVSNMDLLAASVVGIDLLRDHFTIQINRGTVHNVQAGMAVIATHGVVGYILEPELLVSQVLLLTDRYAVIDAIVQRSRAHGLVEGSSRDECSLQNLGRTDDVRVGDIVVTSGLDNIFPKGFPVATVTNVKKNSYGVSQDVDLKPIVNPYQLEEVFVIRNAAREDYLDPQAKPRAPENAPDSQAAPVSPSEKKERQAQAELREPQSASSSERQGP